MANKNTIAIELVVDDKGSVTIKQFGTDAEKSLKGVKSGADDASGGMDLLKSSWTKMGIAAAAVGVAINQAMEYLEKGAKAQQAEKSFRDVATAAGESADQIIDAMKRAAAGTVDDSDIMQKAVKGMLLGFTGNEMTNMMEAARVAARVTGEDVKTAYEKITDAISTNMPRALKQYGLITKEQITLVNKALAAGVDDVKLYDIAIANLAVQQAKLGPLVGNAAENIQAFNAQCGEIGEVVGVVLIRTLQVVWGLIQGVSSAAVYAAGGFTDLVAGMMKFNAFIKEKLGGKEEAENIRKQAEAMAETAQTLYKTAGDLASKGAANIGGYSGAVEKLTVNELLLRRAASDRAKETLTAITAETQAKIASVENQKKAGEELKKLQDEDRKGMLAGIQAQMDADDNYNTVTAQQTAKKIEEAEKVAEEKKKLAGSEYAYLFAQIDEAQEYEIDAGKKTIADAEKVAEEKKKLAEQLPQMYRDVYSDIRGEEKGYYDASMKLIKKQAEAYETAGMDQVVIAKWKANEEEKAFIKMGKSSNDWTDGVKAGLLEIGRAQTTWGTVAFDAVKTFSKDASTAFGSNFYDILTGKFDDLGTAWDTVWKNALKSVTENLGQMVTEALTKDVLMMFKADWTADSSNVLGIINKGWDLLNNLWGGGSSSTSGGGSFIGDPTAPVNAGFEKGGNMPAGGPFWVGEKGPELIFSTAPGYVMEHNQSMAYASRNGGYVPGYSEGGYVGAGNDPSLSGTGPGGYIPGSGNFTDAAALAKAYGKHFVYNSPSIDDYNALMYWYDTFMSHGANQTTGFGYPALTNYNLDNDIVAIVELPNGMRRNIYRDGSYEDFEPKSSSSNFIQQYGGQIVMGGAGLVTGVAWGGAGGAVLGPYIGSTAGTAVGAGAGAAGVGFVYSGGDWKTALIAGITGAALSYVGSYLNTPNELNALQWSTTQSGEELIAGMNNSAAWYDGITKFATKYIAKQALGYTLNSIFGSAKSMGTGKMSFLGADDDGLMGTLQGLMGGMAPKEIGVGFNGVSARNGLNLDYVPYDNFMIRTHEGESVDVTPKEENQSRRSGNAAVVAEIRGLREDLKKIDARTEKYAGKMAQFLEDWDRMGIPGERVLA